MINTDMLIQKYNELIVSNNATSADLEKFNDLLISSYCFFSKSEALKAFFNHQVPQELEIVFADAYNITKEIVEFRSFLKPGVNSIRLLEQLSEDDIDFIIPNLPDYIQMNLLMGVVENKFTSERCAEAVTKYCSFSCIEEANRYRKTIDNINLLKKQFKKVSFIGEASTKQEFKTLRRNLRGKKNVTIVVENENGFSFGFNATHLPTIIKKTMQTKGSMITLKGACGKIESNEMVNERIITLNNGKLELNDCFTIQSDNDRLSFCYTGQFQEAFKDVSSLGYFQFGFGNEGTTVPCTVKCYSTN